MAATVVLAKMAGVLSTRVPTDSIAAAVMQIAEATDLGALRQTLTVEAGGSQPKRFPIVTPYSASVHVPHAGPRINRARIAIVRSGATRTIRIAASAGRNIRVPRASTVQPSTVTANAALTDTARADHARGSPLRRAQAT